MFKQAVVLKKKKQSINVSFLPKLRNKMVSLSSPFVILGAGAWGTALAIHLAKAGQQVRLWDNDNEHLLSLKKSHANMRYLPNIAFPESIEISLSLSEALCNAKDIMLSVPSHAFREALEQIHPYLTDDSRILWVTKGIDKTSGKLLSQVVKEVLGERPYAALSGPSFAAEVAKGLPTAVSIAANNEVFANDLVKYFNHGAFRVYICDDLLGVQLGGAIKNVIAIAVGASDGLRYGANARSALITRGLAEIMRLGVAIGAKQNTFMGLSGLGDLILTCTDDQSRNRLFGLAIAKNNDLKKAESAVGRLVEGVYTAEQVIELAKKHHVEMPICEQVLKLLQQKATVSEIVIALLSRPPKKEY